MTFDSEIKTGLSTTKWIVDIFPFNEPDPQDDVVDSNFLPDVLNKTLNIGQSKNPFKKIIKVKDAGDRASSVQKNTLLSGVTSIHTNRSKSNPASRCNITHVGSLPRSCVVGSWVIVKSITQENISGKTSTKILTRFIGQVAGISSSYSALPSGLISTNNKITVNEWSSALLSELRFDIYSITQANKQDLLGSLATAQFDEKLLESLSKELLNPFKTSELILQLVGSINSGTPGKISDILDKINPKGVSSDKLKKFPSFSVTMPSVPDGVLEALDMLEVKSDEAYTTGFVEFIFGQQTKAMHNKGDWNGIFVGSIFVGGTGDSSVEDYKNLHKSDDPKRATSPGIGVILQKGGFSAWQLLTTMCDPSLYECFTDMIYEEVKGFEHPNGESETTYVGKPVIVFRDKPFLLKMLDNSVFTTNGTIDLNNIKNFNIVKSIENAIGTDESIGGDVSFWTKYDDLPRIFIPSQYIVQFNISTTSMNSPNYIRIEQNNNAQSEKFNNALSIATGIDRLQKQMKRWGGNVLSVETNYLGFTKEGKFDWQEWAKSVRTVVKKWHSYNYRMGNGTLVLKGCNVPFSVGMNVQFDFGKMHKLVGHIISIDTSFFVSEDGAELSETTLELERIVQATATNDLDFIDMSDFGRLNSNT